MGDLKQKPPLFKAGASSLSANDLNKIMESCFRQLVGGAGISVSKMGDRVVISLSKGADNKASAFSLVTILEEFGTYLKCDKDDAIIYVAKPWGLREGVDFPTGPTYEYHTFSWRTATLGEVVEEQYITPDYEVGEELTVKRLISARITDDGDNPILYIDSNELGRCWATEE